MLPLAWHAISSRAIPHAAPLFAVTQTPYLSTPEPLTPHAPHATLLCCVAAATKALRRSAKTMREFLPVMEAAGYVTRRSVKGQYGSFDVYNLSATGSQTLGSLRTGRGVSVMLPVPAAVRAEEKAAAEAALARRSEVKLAAQQLAESSGLTLAAVPESEFEPGAESKDTPVTNGLLQWSRMLAGHRKRGNEAKAAAVSARYRIARALNGPKAHAALTHGSGL